MKKNILLSIVFLIIFSYMMFAKNKEQMAGHRKTEICQWEGWQSIKKEMEYRKETAQLEANKKKMENKKEELIKLCEENQEDLELISEEFLSMLEDNGIVEEGMTWEIAEEKMKQIKNTEWDRLSEVLQPYYPLGETNPEGKVYYCYWTGKPYILKILYIREDAEKYLSQRFFSDEQFIKINEHLYVCIEDIIYDI